MGNTGPSNPGSNPAGNPGNYVNPLIPTVISVGADLYGGYQSDQRQKAINASNVEMQKQFAQQGIRWKVEDAKAAGIHPLYALGAQTTSFQPSSVGSSGLPDAISRSGQNIQRAIDSTRTNVERQDAITKATLSNMEAEREGKWIENQIGKLELQKRIREQNSPPMPGIADEYGLEKGSINSTGLAENWDGSLTVVPSNAIKQRIEDNVAQETMWNTRYLALPNLSRPPQSMMNQFPKAKPGHEWRYLSKKQAFYQIPSSEAKRYDTIEYGPKKIDWGWQVRQALPIK